MKGLIFGVIFIPLVALTFMVVGTVLWDRRKK